MFLQLVPVVLSFGSQLFSPSADSAEQQNLERKRKEMMSFLDYVFH